MSLQLTKHFGLAALACAALMSLGAAAHAQSYQKGPNPTASALERAGPFATRTTDVSRYSVTNFGGGTIYYPTAAGQYGAIAVSPGYTASKSTVTFWGERLSSHGFVVIVIDTLTTLDQPASRARQLKAALDKVVSLSRSSSSPIYNKVDPNRLAVMGHSMGGGGTLQAAKDNPGLKAAIPMAPWNTVTNWSAVTVPTLVMACQADAIAPVANHAVPFYNSMSANKKSYIEMAGDDHLCVMNGGGHDATLGKMGIAWMKRFVDNDTRYSPFLCGLPYQATVNTSEVSVHRNNCPY